MFSKTDKSNPRCLGSAQKNNATQPEHSLNSVKKTDALSAK
jgi:hypothetical protein